MSDGNTACDECAERVKRMTRSKAICTGSADDHPACPKPLVITSGTDLTHRLTGSKRRAPERLKGTKPVVRVRYENLTPWSREGMLGDAAKRRGDGKAAEAHYAEAKRLWEREVARLEIIVANQKARRAGKALPSDFKSEAEFEAAIGARVRTKAEAARRMSAQRLSEQQAEVERAAAGFRARAKAERDARARRARVAAEIALAEEELDVS